MSANNKKIYRLAWWSSSLGETKKLALSSDQLNRPLTEISRSWPYSEASKMATFHLSSEDYPTAEAAIEAYFKEEKKPSPSHYVFDSDFKVKKEKACQKQFFL